MSDFHPGSVAPESLLKQALESAPHLADAAATLPPFGVPYRRLTGVPGWVVWLGHPPAPISMTLLPAPESILWGYPDHALAAGAIVAADYAARRGATDSQALAEILRRESPVLIVVPGDIHSSIEPALQALGAAGLPIVRLQSGDRIEETGPYAARAAGHAIDLGRAHDPVLAFDDVPTVAAMGGNPLSSFVLHAEPEQHGVRVIGEPSERIAMEIGVGGPGIDIVSSARLEREAIAIPSFLDGVDSEFDGQSLRIAWAANMRPSPEVLGSCFQTWLSALYGATTVDVRIVFAPAHGRSAVLTDMRARANQYRNYRAAVIAGDPDAAQLLNQGTHEVAE